MGKQERVEHANQLIKIISDHGRRFFYSNKFDRVAHMFIDARGKIWFVDDYTGKPIYTHYRWDWNGFSHGGTLRSLVEAMRDYIRTGEQIYIGRICTPQLGSGERDIWGYGPEASKIVREAAAALPIIRQPTNEQREGE